MFFIHWVVEVRERLAIAINSVLLHETVHPGFVTYLRQLIPPVIRKAVTSHWFNVVTILSEFLKCTLV